MAGPRILDSERMSLGDLRDEVLFTTLRVRHTPETKAQVAAANKLLADLGTTIATELQLADDIISGEVMMSLRNADLDGGVVAFKGVLLKKTFDKTDHPLFKRFFAGRPPSDVTRLRLRPELPIVEPWVDSLKAESDPDLQGQGVALGKLVKAGWDAVTQYDAAVQQRRDFRAGPRRDLFSAVNASRRSLFGELSGLGRTPDWVNSFFRTDSRRDDSAEPTLAEAEAQFAVAQADLAQAQARLDQARQRAQAATAQAAAREQARQDLLAAERQSAELQRRIATLRSQAQG